MTKRFTLRTVSIGELHFKLQQFADPDREFSQFFAAPAAVPAKAPEPPLYGNIWPAAEGLAIYLAQQRQSLVGLRVLEIGCGLALPSLVCAAAGAWVTAIDHHPDVQRLLNVNTQLNGLPPLHFALASFSDPKLQLGLFDLIIASDILYEPALYPALESFILRHAQPGARVIVADPGRYAVEKFGSQLKLGGEFQVLLQPVQSQTHPIEIRTFSCGHAALVSKSQDKTG